jgi:hypothetical protein
MREDAVAAAHGPLDAAFDAAAARCAGAPASKIQPAPIAGMPFMTRTRLSLYYLATYLSLTGSAFLMVPQWALGLLFATGHYENTFVRFVGAFMIAIAVLVLQIIRYRLEVLYLTTVSVRLFFLAVIVALYIESRDPLFVAVF